MRKLIFGLLLIVGCVSQRDVGSTVIQPTGMKRTAVTQWTDRRPIGHIQYCFGGDEKRTPDNLETWIPQVVTDWKAFTLASLDRAKGSGCQGVLIHDVEGRKYHPPTDYIGHPYSGLSKKIGRTEVKWIVDQAEQRGMWVGFTFRSTAYIEGQQLRTIWPSLAIGEEFLACRRAYGKNVKAIYWDTNIKSKWFEEGGPNDPLEGIWVQRLRDVIGNDVLIIPEFWDRSYEGIPNLAPWNENQGSGKQAVQLLIPPSTVTTEQRKWYIDRMREGAIPLTTVTWDAPNRWILDAYKESQN